MWKKNNKVVQEISTKKGGSGLFLICTLNKGHKEFRHYQKIGKRQKTKEL